MAFSKVLNEMATSYSDLNVELELNPGGDLLHFIYANELQNLYDTVSNFVFGVNKAFVSL